MNARTRRLLASAAAALTLSGVAAATAPATTAAAAPAPLAPDMPPEVLAGYRERFPDVPVDVLYARLWLTAGRKVLIERYATEYAETFSGSWYDYREGVWHLLATNPADAEAMAAPARAAGVVVRPRVVEHSAKKLFARAEGIRAGRDPMSKVSTMAGVDVLTNRVTVAAAPSRRTVRDPMVSYVDPSPRRTDDDLDQACTSRRHCGAPLRSGVVLWDEHERNPLCSLGFVARGSDGSRWAYTAGHCFGPTSTQWGHGEQYLGSSGKCWVPVDPDGCSVGTGGADFGRIRITNDYWLTGGFGWLFYRPSTSTTTGAVEINFAQTTRLQLEGDDQICINAWHRNYPGSYDDIGLPNKVPEYEYSYGDSAACGWVSMTSSPNDYGMPEVANVTVCRGDSGGGWVMYPGNGIRMAAGIHSGRGSRDDDHLDPTEAVPARACSYGRYARFTALDTVNAKMDAYSSVTIRVITR